VTLAHPLLLLALALALRAIPRRSAGEARWRWGVDLGLALLCGAAVAALCDQWLAEFHLSRGVVTGSDFSRYCRSTGALVTGDLDAFHRSRSVASGALAGAFAQRLGVVDGLVWSARAWSASCAAALYLWGRALHGRAAGVCAAIALGAVAPLTFLPRTLTFYPTGTAAFALCGAGAALALRYRNAPAIAAATAAAGWALLVDVRGLFWALPTLGLAALAVAGGPARRLPLRAAALLAPLALAWHLGGSWSYFDDSRSLEQQVATYRGDQLRRLLGQDSPPSPPGLREFVWGHSDLRHLPETLRRLARAAETPQALIEHPTIVADREAQVRPWLGVGAGALLAGALALARRPWRLIALGGSLFPFAVFLFNAARTRPQQRFLQDPMVGLPLVLGLGLVALALGAPGAGRPADDGPALARWALIAARPLAAIALTLLLTLGAIPSHVSPVADWREGIFADDDPTFMIRAAIAGPPTEALYADKRSEDPIDFECHRALYEDLQAGHPPGGRAWGAALSKPRDPRAPVPQHRLRR